jgi:hypothetical protein
MRSEFSAGDPGGAICGAAMTGLRRHARVCSNACRLAMHLL